MYERLYAMRYLLDTHTLIWYFDVIGKIPQKSLEIMRNPDNQIYVSVVSLWEVSILIDVGKIELKSTIAELFTKIKSKDFEILNIEQKHLQKYIKLPHIHGDPFDRLLIATAMIENLTFLSRDSQIHQYDVEWQWN
jgi:PIN domain nuclease of toxin-antitoxin system